MTTPITISITGLRPRSSPFKIDCGSVVPFDFHFSGIDNSLALTANVTGGNGAPYLFQWNVNGQLVSYTDTYDLIIRSLETFNIVFAARNSNNTLAAYCSFTLWVTAGTQSSGPTSFSVNTTVNGTTVTDGTVVKAKQNSNIILAATSSDQNVKYQWTANNVPISNDPSITANTSCPTTTTYQLVVQSILTPTSVTVTITIVISPCNPSPSPQPPCNRTPCPINLPTNNPCCNNPCFYPVYVPYNQPYPVPCPVPCPVVCQPVCVPSPCECTIYKTIPKISDEFRARHLIGYPKC